MGGRDESGTAPARVAEAVDRDRLASALATLAQFGARPDGGVARQALTDVENEARRHLVERARRIGCEVETDDCANLFFRRPGRADLPAVMTGSHIDTQPAGGKYDGAYGVIAGLEVLEALNDAGVETLRPVEVVAWTNEEGSRFKPGAMGSSAYVRPDRLQEYLRSRDDAGITLADALERTFRATTDVPRRARGADPAAFVEAHIEQGPVLERDGLPLGVVTGIQGVRWYTVECAGQAAHAGTTPMEDRRDAMVAAIGIAQRLQAIARLEALCALRMTMGRWTVSPNSINTIPGRVEFSIDARSAGEDTLDLFEARLVAVVHESGATLQRIFARVPTSFPEDLQALVESACLAAAGVAPLRMISGAFHDSMYLAEICPTCMLFVQSRDGLSHNPEEYSSPEHLYLGARALAQVVTTLANRT